MNLSFSDLPLSDTATSRLHVLIEHNNQGNAIATVLEIPNCQAEAPTREQALEALKTRVAARLETAEILSLEIQASLSRKNEKPWMQYAGVFKDDPHFDEFQQSIQDYRQEIDLLTDKSYPELSAEREAS
jgi:predicted RNase H-like HicB family nuclease